MQDVLFEGEYLGNFANISFIYMHLYYYFFFSILYCVIWFDCGKELIALVDGEDFKRKNFIAHLIEEFLNPQD